ncbi:2-oxoglutarate (2OG) and Fe(II)-dependent oxygenase superfamily protein [Melia azedarach]|uniref:2-oxoglutarate (2OG) and Fe(II)-dependent oxygenase superfamily protein n=2 Tax=Melia azedarach TaxID=155640 RepID=A0ACC1Y4Y7_MELAZ|nr:2-oxoglutarate (2OG) and Fe(II)-dependent oxygenase superfamily protein [Melia azedarach]KAJ4718513.1 2-oxoglutarate (2OG) and Fe(II)-dependent oxygenase superfamily protein [Melia azedarach]
MEEKKKQAKGVEEFEGYGADPVPAEGQFLDWSDRLFLVVYPEDQRKLKFWPEKPEAFRGLLEEYCMKMKMVTGITSKAMAKSLNLEENCFLTQFGERALYKARFNYYSRCHRPDLVLGLKPILMEQGTLLYCRMKKVFKSSKMSDGLWYPKYQKLF